MKNIRILYGIILSGSIFNAIAGSPEYLVKPTGQYRVSMVKHQLINTTICPDFYYQESHEWFYKDNANPNHCHRFNLYLYYPVNNNSNNYLNYWTEDIQRIKLDISNKVIESKNIPYAEEYITQEKQLKSFILSSGKIVNQKFPLIVFSPGMGVNSYYYQNIIVNLVSHGYIVAAIDSAYNQPLYSTLSGKFLSQSPVSFESGISSIWESKANFGLADLDFTFSINELKATSMSDPIAKHIDFNQIGGIGQSLGAQIVYTQSRSSNTPLKAGVAMEVGHDKTLLQNSAISIPFMFMNAANLGVSDLAYFGAKSSFRLLNNNFLIKMTPNESNITCSSHMTFSDYSTLRYASDLNRLYNLTYSQKFNEQDFNNWYGFCNGYKITADINSYLIDFFNHYLKHKPTKIFTTCTPIPNKSSLIICGNASGKIVNY